MSTISSFTDVVERKVRLNWQHIVQCYAYEWSHPWFSCLVGKWLISHKGIKEIAYDHQCVLTDERYHIGLIPKDSYEKWCNDILQQQSRMVLRVELFHIGTDKMFMRVWTGHILQSNRLCSITLRDILPKTLLL